MITSDTAKEIKQLLNDLLAKESEIERLRISIARRERLIENWKKEMAEQEFYQKMRYLFGK